MQNSSCFTEREAETHKREQDHLGPLLFSFFLISKQTKMKAIVLKAGWACKCDCRHHTGSDGKDYWVRKGIIYSTDCHKDNPIKATGRFSLNKKIIIQ